MDFAGTDPLLRTAAFAGVLLGAALCAWWMLTRSGAPSLAQLGASVLALATIPAVILAPMEDGTALTVLGLAAIAAFIACGAVTALYVRRMPQVGPAAVATATARVPSASTRVASSLGETVARPGREAEQTAVLSGSPGIAAIAFLTDYSGDGHAYRLGADTRIGRDSAAEITIDDDGASREHARIKFEDGRFVLYDLGSTNGTRLVREGRRRKIAAPAPLHDLDMVEIGDARLVFLSVELPPK